MPPPDRRTVLRSAAALAFLGAGAAWSGCAAVPVPGAGAAPPEGAVVESGSFTTPRWPGRSVGWRLVRPAVPRGTVVALHGWGGNATDWFDHVRVGDHVASTGLAVVSVDGGGGYWHGPRRGGTDPGSDTGAMLTADLLPMLAQRGLPTARVGLLGLSMGGYGALLHGARLGPTRVFGVAAMSAALWTDPGRTPKDAFDSREDFLANDVFGLLPQLRRLRVWLACGARDPFREADGEFARRLGTATTVFDAGGHDDDYWSGHAGAALHFLAAGLPATTATSRTGSASSASSAPSAAAG